MIVRPTPTGWRIIYHRAHALLAAQLAGQWQRRNAPPRLYETIAAISHHDDLEKEWEEDNLTKVGAPRDFTMDTETSFPLLRQHIEAALYRGRWVALLNSMHMSRLLAGQRGSSAEADAFLDEQQQHQATWLQELSLTRADADRAYAFMQWCDRCSLILCQQELPADERALEISKAHDGQRYDIVQFHDELVTVTPWCFEDNQFTVNVEVSLVEQLQFANNAELVAALKQAPRELLEWTFVKDDRLSQKTNELS